MNRPLLRNNGFYHAIFVVNGKQRWRTLGTKDPLVAAERFQTLQSQVPPPRQKGALSLFFDDFIQRMRIERRSATIAIYWWSMGDFIRICGDMALDQVRPLHGERFKQMRVKEGVKNITINCQLRTLKAIFNDAVRMKVLDESPFENLRPLPIGSVEAAFVTQHDLDRILAKITDPEFKDLVKCDFYTALRLGEIVNLVWEHVDMERRVIAVKSFRDFVTKGKPRLVPMHPLVHEILQRTRRRGEYVFPNSSGSRRNQDGVSKRFKRCVLEAGIDSRIHFHSLRHGGLSWMSMNGMPDEMVRLIGGHRSFRTTQIYTHLDFVHAQTVMSRLPAISQN